MTEQPTIAQVRKTQGEQIELMEKLKSKLRTASPAEQPNIQKEIDAIAQEVRNLDTVLQGLMTARKA